VNSSIPKSLAACFLALRRVIAANPHQFDADIAAAAAAAPGEKETGMQQQAGEAAAAHTEQVPVGDDIPAAVEAQ
jgi:hypothetical protein